MGLQQFERRLERLIEGAFAKAFRSGLQPVEIGRRLTREMDLRRTIAPRGTLAPNVFRVALSPEDYDRFAPIEDELVDELVSVANDHAHDEGYLFLGRVKIDIEVDEDLGPGMLLVTGEMARSEARRSGSHTAGTADAAGTAGTALILPDGRRLPLGLKPVIIGRLPECDLVLADPNVSRRHAEIRSSDDGGYIIGDLGSTNGTKVNGLRIYADQRLVPGDSITIGATTIRFDQV